MKKPYDALIFDMDGVLVDVSQSYRKAIKKTAEFFLKREVKLAEINEIKGKVGMNNDWDATYSLINNTSFSYGEVKSVFQTLYLGNKNKRGLIDNEELLIKKDSLLQLRKIYKKMGIATGRPREEAQYVIKKFDLNDIFDVLVAKEDVAREKPFPDPIIKAMEYLGAKKSIYIGDSPSDVVAATAAGIPSLYIGNQNIGTIRFDSPIKIIDYLL